jgi:hypothetical protein
VFENSHQGKVMPSFLPTANQASVELKVGMKRHTCFSYIAKSKAGSEKKQVMQSYQDVQVCGNFVDFCMNSSLFFFVRLSLIFFLDMGYLFFCLFFVFGLGYV